MSAKATFKGYGSQARGDTDEVEVQVSTAWETLNVSIDEGISWFDLEYGQAHALADWIIANVPKPEPIPLPTKFAAVVKADGLVNVLTRKGWVDENGDTVGPAYLSATNFEVIFEGVDE